MFSHLRQVQLLTTEYVPIFCALMLFIHCQAQLSKQDIGFATKAVMVLATAGRFVFAGKVFLPPTLVFPCSFLGATASYIGFAGLIASAVSYTL